MEFTKNTMRLAGIQVTEDVEEKPEEKTENLDEETVAKVDLTGLENEIKKKTGISVKLKGKTTKYGYEFESGDLSNQAGIMGGLYKWLNIEGTLRPTNKDKGWLAAHVDFQWKYKSGGSNGTEIMTVYFEDGKWSSR